MQEFQDKYPLGTRLVLFSNDRSLSVIIDSQLSSQARSQVIGACIESGELSCVARPDISTLSPGAHVVAKVFDPELIRFEESEWLGTREDYCIYLAGNELKAYSKLSSMNGLEVPIFYGQYRFGSALVIVLEFITVPSLFDRSIASRKEREALKMAAESLLRKLHINGVYHRDIQAWNLFWDPESCQLRILDFELAKFEEVATSKILIKQWGDEDVGEMERILVECGLPSERLQIGGI